MTGKKRRIVDITTLVISAAALVFTVIVNVPLANADELIRSLLEEEYAHPFDLEEVPAFSPEPEAEAAPETEPETEETTEPATETPETVLPDEPPPEEETRLPISKTDLSANQTKDSIAVINSSKYNIDINDYAKAEYPLPFAVPVSKSSSEPLVLIIHTHGTEAYINGDGHYTADTPTRSDDITQNVVEVGRVLAEKLNEKGIPTLHCETMFDQASYSGAYDASEKAVLGYLEKNPSIQYVFDVHRDSITSQSGNIAKCVCEIDGAEYAQAMFVVGTDSQGADHPFWRENLKVAAAFQYAALEKYPSLMRPVNLRGPSFNAEHAPGSVLIEIGASGNTLEEAKNTAELLGEIIAEVISGKGGTAERTTQ